MATLTTRRRRSLWLAGALVALGALAACSGGSDTPEADPDEVLADAKATLDDTSGVRIELTSSDLPEDVTGLIAAEGALTRAPAFEGEIVVRAMGFEPRVPVVAVDAAVFAQLPLTQGWQKIDPGEYGAPDPAALIAADGGLSDLLIETTGVEAGESVRGGADNTEVLTTYSGTVPADAIATVFPSTSGEVEATYTITEDGELRTAELTGDFYGSDAAITYTVTLDDYGLEQEISAP
ncbi:LppX_LprAFG lipoprotein [Nocardioides insulae]|uniref:LppX_LprAFG lipoprotein n=1 Tax=Nocardioides insulae TaxID=394734 RepID=UPI0003FBA753|nr:LppX_LprAFG lipoprotein [Nocardioides insulae]